MILFIWGEGEDKTKEFFCVMDPGEEISEGKGFSVKPEEERIRGSAMGRQDLTVKVAPATIKNRKKVSPPKRRDITVSGMCGQKRT